jgi:hypothetical protein
MRRKRTGEKDRNRIGDKERNIYWREGKGGIGEEKKEIGIGEKEGNIV